jgi:uncharacterized Zn finger protein (UPF0148 family)
MAFIFRPFKKDIFGACQFIVKREMSIVCESCNTANFLIDDERAGDTVCTQCGLVAVERIGSQQPETRFFDDPEKKRGDADETSSKSASSERFLLSLQKRPSQKNKLDAMALMRLKRALNLAPSADQCILEIYGNFKRNRLVNIRTEILQIACIMCALDMTGHLYSLPHLLAMARTVMPLLHGGSKNLITQINRIKRKVAAFMAKNHDQFVKFYQVADFRLCVEFLDLIAKSPSSLLRERVFKTMDRKTWISDVEARFKKLENLINAKNAKTRAAVTVYLSLCSNVKNFEEIRPPLLELWQAKAGIQYRSIVFWLKRIAA